VLTVVQWRAPKDLNTLIQHFGHAGRDFLLQAVAILLAEPKWFLEDHEKWLVQKRKRSQKGGKKASRPRAEPGARTSDISSSDNESNSEGETGMNAGNNNNNIPNGDHNREGSSDVEEAIKSINIMAGGTGRGCKRTTNKVMRLFINAHLLCGRKHCCRFHSNHYYRTTDIRKSFILDLRVRFANYFPPFFSAKPPPCCTCCMPKVPSICCNICHPDLIHAMINECNNDYQVVPRGSNVPKQQVHVLTSHASQFRDTLYVWCTETATSMFGALDFWPADLLMHEEMLEDIIIFVDTNKIGTLQDLHKKTNWIFCDEYGNQIILLIEHFFPPAPIPNLFISTPLPLQTCPTPFSNALNSPPHLSSSSSTGLRKPQAPSTCTACFQKGHKSVSTLSFPLPSTDMMQQRTRKCVWLALLGGVVMVMRTQLWPSCSYGTCHIYRFTISSNSSSADIRLSSMPPSSLPPSAPN